jgi:hypothetical protein
MTLNLERTAVRTPAAPGAEIEAGTRGAGEYRCCGCGYGIVTLALVPACPMCHGTTWRATSEGPFGARPGASPEH